MRYEPFPLKVARNRSVNDAISRARRQRKRSAFSEKFLRRCINEERVRYAKVKLGFDGKRWFLFYPGSKFGTGGFPTRWGAIDWFLRGGR